MRKDFLLKFKWKAAMTKSAKMFETLKSRIFSTRENWSGIFLFIILLCSPYRTDGQSAGVTGITLGHREVTMRLQFEIQEEQPPDTPVGVIPTKINFTYRFNEYIPEFRLNSTSGEITTAIKIDRERLRSDRFDLVILSSQPTYPIEVRIVVIDINDNSPMFPEPFLQVAFSENANPGTRVILDTATDLDTGENGISTNYKIVSGNEGVLFQLVVTTNPSGETPYLHLETLERLDRERQAYYTLNISAQDGGRAPRFGYVTVNITVLDVNDNPPIFDHSDYSVSLNESVPLGTSVLQVRATDSDSGDNARITYYLSETESQFSVDPLTGVISTGNTPLNCEQLCADNNNMCHKSCVFTVLAKDHGSPRQDGRAYVTVNLLDANDHDPIIKFRFFPATAAYATVDENAQNGSVVAAVSVIDYDEGLNGETTVEIRGGNEEGHFRLESSSSFDLVRVQGVLDRELINKYNLTITATDKGVPPRSSTAFLIIYVNDINDHEPIFQKSDYSVVLSESVPIGTSVASIMATDEDTGINSNIFYSFSSGNERNWFSIDPLSGLVTTVKSLNREEADLIELKVSARDGGPSPRWAYTFLRIQILDVNDETPKFYTPVVSVSLEENVPAGSVVTVLSAADNDLGSNGSVAYSLHPFTEKRFPGIFAVDSSFGRVLTSKALDRENIPMYNILVVAKDHGQPSLSSTCTIQLTLLDVNDNAPIFYPSLYFGTLAGSAPRGTEVTWIRTYDLDENDNARILYSISAGADGKFDISEDGRVRTTASFGGTNGRSRYELLISASNPRGPEASHMAHVYVYVDFGRDGELRFQHTDGGYRFSLEEDYHGESPNIGRHVGQVSAGHRVRYLIIDGDPDNWFSIDERSGSITTSSAIDREVRTIVNLTIVAFDLLAFCQTSVIIEILDVNDCFPEFPDAVDNSIWHLEVPENFPPSKEVYLFQVTDTDEGDNGKVTFKLSKNPHDLFDINAQTGMLLVKRSMMWQNFEDPLEIELTAEDRGLKPLASKLKVSVHIVDVNDHTPCFTHSTYEISVREGTPPNERIFSLSATDEDLGENAHVTYEILPEGNAENRFGVFPDGSIFVKHPLDREYREFYSLTVVARDNGTHSRMSTATLSIHVTDENDNAPHFVNETFVFQVSENEPPDTFVGRLLADDLDRGRNAELTFTLKNHGKDFVVDPKSGLIKTLHFLDRESLLESTGHDFFVLEASVTDNGLRRLKSEAKVTILVTDVNDNPPVFTRNPIQASVSESSGSGHAVVRVVATDKDEGINGYVLYSITDGNTDGCFDVDETTGQISVVGTLDRETTARYELVITAQNAGESVSFTSSASLTIDVLDENDNAPRFSLYDKEVVVKESISVGEPIAFFRATDPDLGANGEVTYSIVAGNMKEVFRIDAKKGMLYVARPLDYEERQSYSLNISASDGGNPRRLSSYVLLRVIVEDVNDNSPVFPTAALVRQLEESLVVGSPVATVTADDKDSGDNGRLVYSISGQHPPGQHFSIREDTGLITTQKQIDREFSDTFRLTVVASDLANPPSARRSAEKTITIIVTDINDNSPTFVSVDTGILMPGTRKGQKIMTLKAHDPDASMNGAVTYELIEGLRDLFTVDRNSGDLTLLRDVQRPEVTYTLTVQATDEALGPLRKSSRSKITILGGSEKGVRVPDFSSNDYTGSIFENAPVGSSLLQVRAQSISRGKIEYYLTSVNSENGIEPRVFAINRYTGVISTAMPIDRESGPGTYVLQVYASEIDAPLPISASTHVKINILDVNDNPPTFIDGPYKVSVSEDATPGSTICKMSATDKDSEGVITYKTSTDQDIFILDEISGTVILKEPLDREIQPYHEIVVFVTDGVQTSQTTLTVEVLDTNDNPPAFKENVYSFDVPENVPRGSEVGTISAVDSDLGINSHVSYTVISDWGNDAFSLNPQSGVFTLTSRLDFEQVQHYIFVVQAQDSGQPSLSSTVTVYFNVLDVNDNAPLFDPMSYSNEVFENITVGSSIIKVCATDTDSGDNGKVVYNIVEGDKNHQFAVAPSGSVYTTKPLDREKQSFYTLTVSATDLASPEEQRLTSTVQVTVVLKDVNDKAPIFVTPNKTAVMENVPLNTVIMAVKAVDLDEGRNSYVEYSINHHSNNLLFTIGPVDGFLRVNGAIDRELQSEHVIEVTAKDRGFPSQSTSVTIIIDVLDENDNNPIFSPDEYVASVPEDANIDHAVLQVFATDRDSNINSQIRYSIVAGDHNHDFMIREDTGIICIQKNLDYERQNRYILTVQAEDSGHDVRYDTATVIISILDVNDNPPVFVNSPYEIHVMENLQVLPSSLGTLTVKDVDSQPDDKFQYLIKDGNKKFFKIDSNTGEIFLLKSLDREKMSEYSLTVLAIDSGSPRQTGTGTVNIIVSDANDNAPQFDSRRYIAKISENMPPYSPLLNVTAVDTDIGLNGLLRYSLVGQDGKFSVDPETGLIKTTMSLDREEKDQFDFKLVVQDSGMSVQYSTEAHITVLVEDENDHQPQFAKTDYTVYIPETATRGHYIFGDSAEDSDDGQNSHLVYHLSGPDMDKFQIDQDTGVVLLNENLHNKTDGYEVEVHVSDSGLLPLRSSARLLVKLYPAHLFPFFLSGLQNFVLSETTKDKLVTTISATSQRYGRESKVTYRVSGGNIRNCFTIGTNSGELKASGNLDYESVTKYELWVEARDNGFPPLSSAIKLEIQITDVNDNAPSFDKDVFNVTVGEELHPPVLVTSVKAVDPDNGLNGDIQYYFSSFSSESLFSIDSRTGEIYTKAKLDREEKESHTLVVKAVDQGIPQLTSTATVLVTLLDKNDNPPRFTRLFSVNVTENALVGTFVIQVTSSDRDIGENANATYTFTENPGEKFHIDAITGNVTIAGKIDRELREEYLVKVAAVDGAWHAETLLTVSVQDVNDNAPEFSKSNYVFMVPELQPLFSFVGQVNAVDSDKRGPNSAVSYYLKTVSEFFHLNSSSGEIVNKKFLNYKQTKKGSSPINQHFLKIIAVDHGWPPMSSEVLVTITVVDTNNYQPQFTRSHYFTPITEDSSVGLPVIRVCAEDNLDEGINAEVQYRNTGGNGTQYFSVNEISGWITIRNTLLGLKGQTLTLEVEAHDLGVPPRSTTALAVFTVTGENNFSPLFSALSYQVIISEAEPVGSIIISITATDADEGLNGKIVYNITSGDQDKNFAIDENHGAISVIKALDYEQQNVYHLNISITDSGFHSRESSAVLTVLITDVNDNPPLFNSSEFHVNIEENLPPGVTVTQLVAVDKDSNRNAIIQYSIVDDTAKEYFSIESSSGVILSKVSFDFEKENIYTFEVIANNPGTKFFSTAKVVVHISGQNEYYPKFLQPMFQFTVSESSKAGTTVGKVLATDEDEGPDGKVFFLLVGRSNQQGFHIDTESGVITVARKLDRESQSRVVLTVMAKNEGSIRGNDTDEAHLVITIEDGNDPPLFAKSLYIAHISEDVSTGSSVLMLVAHDTDIQPNNSHFSYSIIGGSVEAFTIDPQSGLLQSAMQLDREELDEYNLIIAAVDSGSPPQTGTTVVQIIVDDVNDNGPFFDEESVVGYVPENEPSYTSVMVLKAEDRDLPPNGGPFMYFLTGGNHKDLFELDRHTGLLKTTATLDRESISEAELIVEVYDNGSPQMKSEHMIQVFVSDKNDCPSSPRALSVFVWTFEKSFPGGKIADVRPLDPDIVGNYHCAILKGSTSLFSIPQNCDLFILNVNNPRNYTLTVAGSDGKHPNVTSTVRIEFMSFSNESIANSLVIQIPNTTSSDFVSIKYERFQKTLNQIFKEAGQPVLYSIATSSAGSVELTLAVRQGHQYLPTADILSALAKHESLFQDIVPNAILGYNPCLNNPCKNSGMCMQFLQLQNKMSITDSPSLVIAAPAVQQKFTCICERGFSGLLCQYQEDPCSPNPCLSGGICHPEGNDFRCICAQKLKGKICDIPSTSSCASFPCKNGGTCKDDPNGSFFCICRPGFRGTVCEHTTDNCRPNRCLNGGICISNKHSYHCICEDSFYGRHCEHATYGFHPYSFMAFPSLDTSTNDISVVFATNKKNSLLVYNHGQQTGGRSDFFALEIVEGHPFFSFGGARTAIAVLQIKSSIADGKWYKITAIRNGKVATLSVVSCTKNGVICDSCSPDNSSCSVSLNGHTGTLNFNDNPMYLGGVPSVDPLVERPGQLATDDFVGCIQSISVNGKMLNLGSPLMAKHTTPTCSRKSQLCIHSNNCGTSGKCIDHWFSSMCLCSVGIIAPNCNEALQPFSFGADESFVEIVPMEKHRRAQMLSTASSKQGKGREKRLASPVKHTKWLSVMFRTRSPNGLLLSSVTDEDFTLVQLNSGQVVYSSKTSNSEIKEILTSGSVSDGDWHTLKLEMEQGSSSIINITIDTLSYVVRREGLHDILDPYLTSLTLGGGYKKSSAEDSDSLTNFQGCMMRVTVNGEVEAENSTDSYFQLKYHGRIHRGCSDEALGLDLAPTDPLNIGIILVIVFFIILIVVILISFVVFRQRKLNRDKNLKPVKHNGVGFLASVTADIPRNPQDSVFSGITSTEEMLRNHITQDLLPKKIEREGNIEKPQRPDIIEQDVVNKSPTMPLPRVERNYLHEKPTTPHSFGNQNLMESEAPEHYDLENASSIAPSDIDICYHYKGFRDGNFRKYKTNPHVPNYHKHNHRHSPHQFQSPLKRDSPRVMQQTSNHKSESPSALRMPNTPLARLSPSSELSQQAPRILTLQDISGKPLQTALLATSQGVGPNSERSLTSPVSHLTSSIHSGLQTGKNNKDAILSLGLTAEEIERLNTRPRNSSLVSTLDAVSLSSDDNHEKNKLAELLETNTELLEAAETSSDESGNDSFTCSEFEYDNNYDKVHRDFSPGNMIFSKLAEEDNENEEDSAKTYDGFDSFRGSLSTLVASDDDLSNLSSYTPTNGTLLGWDYLLNWGLNFQNLAGVFHDIAELPNSAHQGKSNEQHYV